MKNFLHICLKGMGQIMLQENAWTGGFFLLGIAVNSPIMFTGGLAGLLTGTAAARILRFSENDIRAGLYGFNAALVGVALTYFHQAAPVLWVLIVAGAALSALLMRWMQKKFPLPAFTAPFVVVTWAMLVLAHGFGIPAADRMPAMNFDDFGFFKGWGQIIFQGNALSGLLFLVGIAINSRPSALWGAFGNVASMASAFAVSGINVAAGLAGYNGILSAIALGGDRRRWIFPLIGAVLTVIIMLLWRPIGIPALTMPFVAATWIILGVCKKWPSSTTTSS